jgi:hypothetical protein
MLDQGFINALHDHPTEEEAIKCAQLRISGMVTIVISYRHALGSLGTGFGAQQEHRFDELPADLGGWGLLSALAHDGPSQPRTTPAIILKTIRPRRSF